MLSSDIIEICFTKYFISRRASHPSFMNMPNMLFPVSSESTAQIKWCIHSLLLLFWTTTVTISQFYLLSSTHLLRACHGTQYDTWSERFNMEAAWLMTMTNGSSTPLLRCGSVRTCSDLPSTSTRATASQNAPMLTSIWHTSRWVTSRWMMVDCAHLASPNNRWQQMTCGWKIVTVSLW